MICWIVDVKCWAVEGILSAAQHSYSNKSAPGIYRIQR